MKRSPKKTQDEAAFLETYDVSHFERPSLAVDVALLGIANDELVVLLIARDQHPYRGKNVLPGGFLRLDESLDAAAARVLAEKASLRGVFLEQLYTFGSVERDPRTRVVSVAYYALVDAKRFERAASGAATIGRIRETARGAIEVAGRDGRALDLGFDHAQIVETAVRRVRGKLDYAPIGYELLPARFTLMQLQRVHEIVAGRPFNKDSFRRRMLASDQLEATGDVETDVGHRPATLYRYVTS